MRAKTIQIFLPSGDPAGIQVAELTTGIVQLIEVPRKLIQEFLGMPQSKQVGVYFLVGENTETGEPAVYIGQSGNIGRRLDEHHQSEKFDWNRVLVAVSLKHSFTSTHVLHLEWQCIQQANQAQRYKVLNGNAGTKPYVPMPLEADCEEFFHSIRMLLATLGQRFLESVAVHVVSDASTSGGGMHQLPLRRSIAKAKTARQPRGNIRWRAWWCSRAQELVWKLPLALTACLRTSAGRC